MASRNGAMRLSMFLAAAIVAVAIALSSAEAGGLGFKIGLGGTGVAVGSSAKGDATVMSGGDGEVLCCWYCRRDAVTKCGTTSESFCAKWGHEVSSCSECEK